MRSGGTDLGLPYFLHGVAKGIITLWHVDIPFGTRYPSFGTRCDADIPSARTGSCRTTRVHFAL